ncbi:hypothetical protein HII36_05310 [Nonomuraea sp. NN258]|nr:hypothetical protein [Nonomuraea antri]
MLRGADKDGLPPDRDASQSLKKTLGAVDEVVQENAAALVRAIRHYAREGHTQFADLGCGRPLQGMDKLRLPDLADVAAQAQPDRLWVALDSDVQVITACRALLTGPGVNVVQEDLRRSAKVLDALSRHLDMTRPVVVILGAALHFLDDQDAKHLMIALRARLPQGSLVIITHVHHARLSPERIAAGQAEYERKHGVKIYVRSRDEIAALACDFTLQEPGVVRTIDFRPDQEGPGPVQDAPHFLMLAAKRPAV